MSKYIQETNLNILWNTICKIKNISNFCSKEKLNEIFNNIVNYYYNEIKDTKLTLTELQNLNRNTICSIIEELNKYKETLTYEKHGLICTENDEKVIPTDDWNNLIKIQTQERNETIRELFPQPIMHDTNNPPPLIEDNIEDGLVKQPFQNISIQREITNIKKDIEKIFVELEKINKKNT